MFCDFKIGPWVRFGLRLIGAYKHRNLEPGFIKFVVGTFCICQLYLLGLPNKLGPLGYIALHNVLEDEDEGQKEEIVDIKIESLSVADDTEETAPKYRKRW